MKRALVAGGTGFIGRRLVDALTGRGVAVSVLTRDPGRAQALWNNRRVRVQPGDITEPATLRGLCDGHDTVFHLAGYAHADSGNDRDDRTRHESVTVSGTRYLLEAAREARVGRFVYASSVKAMGEGGNSQLDEDMRPDPATIYGRTRLEAEELVLAAGRQAGMHAAVLRLPLVYGPGNKGNIQKMVTAIDQGRFPPWPAVKNRRSMVHVDDVAQALVLAAVNPAAGGQVFIVTDGHAYSTREIYEAICMALGRPVPAWSVPAWLLRLGAMAGDVLQHVTDRPMPLTSRVLDKLLGSAWYSSDKIRRRLGFTPTRMLHEALPEIVADCRAAPASRFRRSPDG